MQRLPLRLAATVAALSPVSLVLSHNLSFLAAYGAGANAALLATGHDAAWTSAVRGVISVTVLLGMLAVIRVASLWRTAHRLERERAASAPADWHALARTVLTIWVWLALVTAVWFLVQENVERISIGQSLPGLGPLIENGLAGPLPIIAAVSLVVALIGGLFRWGTVTLRARIAAATPARPRHRPGRVRRPDALAHRRSSVLSRNLGLRAPPTPLAV
jgi:hypothetical protein